VTTTAGIDPGALVRDDGVRREIYRDAEVFALEMERIFKRTWVFMAHDSELAASGDYLTMRIGTEPVVLVRGEDDQVRVLVNRCMHRGAIVCERAAGNAKSFRCQYHGWTYRNDGQLVGVPYPERQAADVRERLGLVALPRVESYRGLIFASFNPGVPPLTDYLGPGAIGYIDRFLDQCLGLPLVAHKQAHRIAMGANWKLQLENGMDGYHAGFTHRSFFEVMQRRLGTSVRYASGLPTATSRAFRNGHCAIDPETTSRKPLMSRVATLPEAAERLALLRAEVGDDKYEDFLGGLTGAGINVGIFPNLQLIGVHIRRIDPVAVNQTVVSVRPLLADGALFYGPAGFGQPDDFEMFERVEAALGDTQDGWFRFERGLGAEQAVDEGDTTLGNVSDETPQRGQYKQWAALMTAEG
jgi:anthranilate 1,2-dioxygenase (deaminating, decarboxylating) large subunit